MALKAIYYWTSVVWAAVPLVLMGFCIICEIVRTSRQSWQQRFTRLFIEFPLLFVGLLFVWPVIVILIILQIRQEWLLERLISERPIPEQPGRLSEKDWLRGRDPARLMARASKLLSNRQRRLFASACCRRLLKSIVEPVCRQAVELAEQLSEEDELSGKVTDCLRELDIAAGTRRVMDENEALIVILACQDCLTGDAAAAAFRAAGTDWKQRRTEQGEQMKLLREIVGNPFHPPPRRTFPPEVKELARACDAGENDLWPLLADALEELGEDEAATHCRSVEHCHGCHVVEWILREETPARKEHGVSASGDPLRG